MANPQWEDGHTKIANELMDAVFRSRLDGLEHDILYIIMALTYRRQQVKAAISLEDIRYQLGDFDTLRPNRISAALEKLINKRIVFRQITGETWILGIQKDHEKWLLQPQADKMSEQEDIIYINSSSSDKMSANEALVSSVERALKAPLVGKKRFVELKKAREMLEEATRLTGSLKDGMLSVKDFLDYNLEDDFFCSRVNMPLTYMLSRYSRWQRNLPTKPKDRREWEVFSGKRTRYNVRTKLWEAA